ncbi:cobalamin biosynthesis protein CobQ [Candidatus Bathyarchaeota archaeon]|nr:MAG: cobalamin biosynthesis protein CobQ [Candidatus Bathyarchaeota archaeon]
MQKTKLKIMTAKKIMIQATGFGTGVGKSFVVALLCRLFSEDGYKVAPYKTLNLTPVTYVKDGREFGYAQALQAIAAGQEPDYRMNPFTPKPLGNGKFDIFLEGKCIKKNYDPGKYFIKRTLTQMLGFKEEFEYIKDAAKRCLESLLKEYDIICIEGSGPAKLLGFGALSDWLDIANMETARIADAPVLFVTDNLDSIPGALSYLKEEERRRVKGVILNKFRTNEFLGMGIKEIYIKLGIKRIKSVYSKILAKDILGVIPYFPELLELPDLDPLVPSPKIPFDIWGKTIKNISKRAREHIDLNKIYRIMY